MENTLVKELSKIEEWLEAFEVMSQLRTHLNKESYINLLEDMKKVLLIYKFRRL